MHRQMRRIKQQLSHEAAVQVMREATSGVLALEGDDGYPYAVPTGRVHVLEDDEERLRGLRALAEKYNPGQQESAEKEISGALSHVAVIAFEVEELTGKQARELASREAKASQVE